MLLPLAIASVCLLRGVVGDTLWCQVCDCSSTDGVVNCSHSDLRDVPRVASNSDPGSFAAIYLDDNSISGIPAFPDDKLNVTIMSFRNNKISKIANAAFRYIGGLKEIDLTNNHLASDMFKGDVFRGKYSPEGYEPLEVEVLKLSKNGLHTLDPDLFEHLPKLRELYLDSNPLSMIDHPTLIALANIPLLEFLDLSRTQISSIPESMLHTSKNLRVLNISFNEFEDIPYGIESTHQLQCLVLNGNPIQEIRSSPYMPSLKRLELASMPKLRRIGKRALGNFTNLKELFIVNNTHLFDIADDALVYEDESQLKTWPQITELNISYNKLAWLDSEFIANWDKIENFDFGNNPWVCDCQNQWFLYELIPAIYKIQPGEAAKMKCQDPIEMRGMSMLQLSQDGARMRCLDKFGHQPEKDATILVLLMIGTLFLVPMIIATLFYYQRNFWRPFSPIPSCSYQRTGSLETIYHQ